MEIHLPNLSYVGILIIALVMVSIHRLVVRIWSKPTDSAQNLEGHSSISPIERHRRIPFLWTLTLFLGLAPLEKAVGRTAIVSTIFVLLTIVMMGTIALRHLVPKHTTPQSSFAISRIDWPSPILIERLTNTTLVLAVLGSTASMFYYEVGFFRATDWIFKTGPTYTSILIAALLLASVPRLMAATSDKPRQSAPAPGDQSEVPGVFLFLSFVPVVGFAFLEKAVGQTTMVTAFFVLLILAIPGEIVFEYYGVDSPAREKAPPILEQVEFPIDLLALLGAVIWVVASIGIIGALVFHFIF